MIPDKINNVFRTHLREDQNVGLPSLISSGFKFGAGANNQVYGRPGVDLTLQNTYAARRLDRGGMGQSHRR